MQYSPQQFSAPCPLSECRNATNCNAKLWGDVSASSHISRNHPTVQYYAIELDHFLKRSVTQLAESASHNPHLPTFILHS